jgi:hypothetical protein
VTVVALDPRELVNVNTQAELRAVAAFQANRSLEDTAP